MSIRLYNTYSRTKEPLETRTPDAVGMYVCGPTVYNHIHIGNARTFLSFDVIRRYLEFSGLDVTFVQNITDVDDKIINRSIEEGRSPEEVAVEYTIAFKQAMSDLGVQAPTVSPKATETIPGMIAMTERLIERGHAYETDGDVYFSVRSFPEYGKLSGHDIEELECGSRVDVMECKEDALDFALWKAAKPDEPHWPSPWGEGRPGWHLECSVMSEAELGVTFDIHGGASDLIFPHHENEIAQSEAATGEPFVRYWLHGGLLQVNEEKMSKSTGNFMLLKDVLATYDAPVIRLMMLQTHYRSPLEFSTARLDEAVTAYERLNTLVRNVRWARGVTPSEPGALPEDREALAGWVAESRKRFIAEMDDDFNTAGALAAVFELARAANTFLSNNQGAMSATDFKVLADAEDTMVELLEVLGIEVEKGQSATTRGYPSEVVDLAVSLAGYAGSDPEDAVAALLAARSVARSEKNWAAADAVRDGLADLGFVIEDTASGARVNYVSRG